MRSASVTLVLAAALIPPAALAATPPSPADFARRADTVLAAAYPDDAPGVALLVMRGDEVLYRGARGEADVDAGVALQPGDRFRIGSVSKQISSAGLLTLVDAGKVSLDAPLSDYLPDFPGGAGITIEQLLNHTAGIGDHSGAPPVTDDAAQRVLTTAQLVEQFADETPAFAPGDAWRYSNSGYVLVGAVIEAASGLPWHEYLAQAVFAPLGMKNTGYGFDPAVVANLVKGHSRGDQGLAPPGPTDMTESHAPGGLVSTVDDLARFNRGLHEGRLLKPETYARMITPAGRAADIGYGYGFETTIVRGAPAFLHSGGTPGFTAALTYVQGPDVTVAVLLNTDAPFPAQDPRPLVRRFAAAAMGDPYPDARPVAVAAEVLQQYEGIYRVDEATTRMVRVIDGKLTVQRVDRPRFELIAIADDTFVYPDAFDMIRMERDATGNVTGMRFWPDGEGDGEVALRTDQPLPKPITLPREALERLTGTYRSAQGIELRVAIDGDALSGQITGMPEAMAFVALAPGHFTADSTGAGLRFDDGTGPAPQVTLRQWGEDMTLERVPDGE